MASLVLKMSVSLDGYVAPPDGSTDWAAAGRCPDGASWTLETVSNAGAHLMGAETGDTVDLGVVHRVEVFEPAAEEALQEIAVP